MIPGLTTLQNKQKTSTRFIEIDILRGTAIACMIFLHLLWDLDYFGLLPLNENIYQFNKIIPSIFFCLVGICLIITYQKKYATAPHHLIKHLFYRGLGILILGMIITAITMVFLSDRPIFFGVLHCIGLSIILSIPFLRFKQYNFVFGSIFILIGLFVNALAVHHPTIVHLILGLHPPELWRYTIDYFPILPWFGVCLFGIAIGSVLYKDGMRQFRFPNLMPNKPVSMISWLGQHSLVIYLLHQPVIAGVLGLYILL